LLEDLQRLPEGDLTWVKKNGDNLSGGQRQRISLARAVFKNAGIYLLDDPMSAIDPCLRVRIFDQIFGNRGLLRKKTRIIITKDQRFLLKQAVGALGERSDKSDFSLLPWDSFSQEIRNLLLFYCQKSLNLLQMQ
jgi:hypothetical protein